jgi:hypothetical protein
MQALTKGAERRYSLWRQARDAALLFVAAMVVWQLVARVVRRSFTPPGNAGSLMQMSKTDEPITHLSAVVIDGRVHYVWLGRTVWLAAPSGPACYVFDSRGALIASTPTTGDLELHQYCDAAWTQPSLALPGVLEEIRRAERAR